MRNLLIVVIVLVLTAGCANISTEKVKKTKPNNGLTKQDRERANRDTRGHRARPMTQRRLDNVLDQYETNNDQQVTWKEFNEWRRARFDKTDENNNGTVDVDEYLYEFEERLDDGYEEAREAQLKQTDQRFKALDKDQSGYIEWSEYKASGDRILTRWDTNKDGVFDKQDPKPESYNKSKKVTDAKYKKCKGESEWDRDQRKFKNRLARILRMPSSHNKKGMMKIYDANEDEKVTAEEFSLERRSKFRFTDVDRDGKLSAEEYKNEYENRVDNAIDKSRRGSIKQTYVRFGVLDDNDDEAMTFEEFQLSGKRMFTRWDKNEDNIISSADIQKCEEEK